MKNGTSIMMYSDLETQVQLLCMNFHILHSSLCSTLYIHKVPHLQDCRSTHFVIILNLKLGRGVYLEPKTGFSCKVSENYPHVFPKLPFLHSFKALSEFLFDFVAIGDIYCKLRFFKQNVLEVIFFSKRFEGRSI